MTRRAVTKTGGRVRLTAADQRVLDGLLDLPGRAVSRCADVLHDRYMRFHRGARMIGGHKVVYGNDGFTLQDDKDRPRSQLEVVRVAKTIEHINEFWEAPVYKINGFGLSSSGYTWAMRVETGYFAWDNILDTVVWDAWFRVCYPDGKGHPFPNRLRQEIRQMFWRAA